MLVAWYKVVIHLSVELLAVKTTHFVKNNYWSICQDDYELTGKIIAKGAFGDVLEARLIRNSQRVVVLGLKP